MFWRANYSSDDEKDRALRDVELARRVGGAIDKEYPGHYFRVEVDSNGGVVQIRHPLMPPHLFFVIKINDLDPYLKVVKRAAGELLERVNQRRGRRHEGEWNEARKKHHSAIHGLLTETNWRTGETRHVLPSEWQ